MTDFVGIFDTSIGDLLKSSNVDFDAVEKAASLVFIRAERFIEGYSTNEHIIKICKQFFGNSALIQKEGLIKQYKKMKQLIEHDNLMGLVLYGMNTSDILIDYYPTVQGNIIPLTIDSICKCLVREHFTKEEVDTICRRTDGFKTYYKPD